MRKIGMLATISILLGAGWLGATLVPASSQQATTIRVYERHRSGFEKFVNTDGKKNIDGDYIVAARPLYRTGTKKKVGHNTTNLTIIHESKRDAKFRAAATFVLGADKIEVAGTSAFSHLRKGAAFTITGGTGAYAGASGTVKVREAKGRPRTFFTFTLNP